MKKYAIALSALSLALLSGTASASKGDIHFVGAVSDSTCDLGVTVGGVVSNTIQLGTTSVNSEGTAVDFDLKPKDATQGGCASLAATNEVVISFGAHGLSDEGLPAQSGLAKDAYVTIYSKNASETATNSVAIKKGNESRKFKGDVIKDTGAQFKASLVGKTMKGDYQSAVAFVVTYM
ncbi:TPA: fimbrial protein PefA [Salmonella enterica subsp. enterica serovar Poona]|nr:fimbrial protein PefA [Salmonella enterica]EKB5042531.1 fimbrial protein PefA [Salmonella enterica]EME1067354.1 fimbrial protein PefA [Salmonella enterica]